MRKTRLLGFIALTSILVAVLLVGSVHSTKAGETKNILKIGLAMPISGPASAWGIPISNVLLLMAEKMNSDGALKVDGKIYNIDMILVDTKFTPEGSAAAAHKLIYNDKVKFIFGPIVGHEILAVQVISEPEKVIVFGEGWDNETIEPDKPYTFRFTTAPYEVYPALWNWVKESYPDVKKVAILNTDTESGLAAAENLAYLLPRLGYEVVADTYYPYGVKDFMPYIIKILASKPDAMSVEGDPPTMALICKQFRESGYKGHFFQADPIDAASMVEIAGKENLEGWVTSADVAAQGPMATPFALELKQAYIDKYGNWDDIAFAGSFTYMLDVLKEAMEVAGSLDTEKVHAVLESGRTFNCRMGSLIFRGGDVYGQDHQSLYGGFIGQIQNGKTTLVHKYTVEDELEWHKLWPKYGKK